MSGRLANKVAIITGAGVGMGRASVLRFLEEGARVAALDINGETLAETRRQGEAVSPHLWCRQVDITDEAAVRQAVAEVVERFRHGGRAVQQRRRQPRGAAP